VVVQTAGKGGEGRGCGGGGGEGRGGGGGGGGRVIGRQLCRMPKDGEGRLGEDGWDTWFAQFGNQRNEDPTRPSTMIHAMSRGPSPGPFSCAVVLPCVDSEVLISKLARAHTQGTGGVNGIISHSTKKTSGGRWPPHRKASP